MMVTKKLFEKLAVGLGLLLAAGSATADWALNMTPGVTPVSREVFDLHMLVLWICVVIGVVVFGLIIWSVVFHRKAKGAVAAGFHHNTAIEIVWTVIPMLVLIGMAIPATRVLVDMADTSDSELTIKVTGYQWFWEYEYLEDDISFVSRLSAEANKARQLGSKVDPRSVPNYLRDVDKPLVVPINTKIRFLLTANDVIHAWWVPELGWKQDTIPGFINEAWTIVEEPGVYRGQCAELCGRDHAFMPVVVIAVTQEEFEQWVAEQKGDSAETQAAAGDAAQPQAQAAEAPADMSMDDLMQHGEQVYTANCVACHQADGQGMPPTFPALAGSDVATGPVAEHINTVLNGRNAMPAFGPQLSDKDIAAVVTYTRNAFGNDTGDQVQPADVQAAR